MFIFIVLFSLIILITALLSVSIFLFKNEEEIKVNDFFQDIPAVFSLKEQKMYFTSNVKVLRNIKEVSIDDLFNLAIFPNPTEFANYIKNITANKSFFKPHTFRFSVRSIKFKNKIFDYDLRTISLYEDEIFINIKSNINYQYQSKTKYLPNLEANKNKYIEDVSSRFNLTTPSSFSSNYVFTIHNFDNSLIDYDSEVVKLIIKKIYFHLSQSVQRYSVVTWMGGAKFMITSIATSEKNLKRDINNISKAFEKSINFNHASFFVNYSLVVSTLKGEMNLINLQKLESQTIYCTKVAKDEGFKFYLFSEQDNKNFENFLGKITLLKNRVDNESLDVFYSPIISVDTEKMENKIIGYLANGLISNGLDGSIIKISSSYELTRLFGNDHDMFEKSFITIAKNYFSKPKSDKSALFVSCPLGALFSIQQIIDKCYKDVPKFNKDIIVLNIIDWGHYLFDEIHLAISKLKELDILFGFQNSSNKSDFYKLLILKPNVMFLDNEFISDMTNNIRNVFMIKTIVRVLSSNNGVAIAPFVTDKLQLETLNEVGVKGLGGKLIQAPSKKLEWDFLESDRLKEIIDQIQKGSKRRVKNVKN